MYSYDEEPLSVFPTANCYPTQDISKIDEFSVLQHLISGKDIFKYVKYFHPIFKINNLYL